jgi:energy-coupling factor transport system ATP-binding protein
MRMEIRIQGLSFTYPGGIEALRAVSLTIQPGERLAIIGQNGAGKTTLVKHFNGLLRPIAGRVIVAGWDTTEHTTAQMASLVGYVFQNPDDQLFQSSVFAEVSFGPKRLGWGAERVAHQTTEALQRVELSDCANRHPYDLSPGQRKRVALAAVLAMDTPIIILDEPTTGQDWLGVQLIGRIVTQLNAQGKTVITITHDIDFCAENFARVVAMSRGQIVLDGPARQVMLESETLAQTYVEPPQLVRLASRLGLDAAPLTVAEFVDSRYIKV